MVIMHPTITLTTENIRDYIHIQTYNANISLENGDVTDARKCYDRLWTLADIILYCDKNVKDRIEIVNAVENAADSIRQRIRTMETKKFYDFENEVKSNLKNTVKEIETVNDDMDEKELKEIAELILKHL